MLKLNKEYTLNSSNKVRIKIGTTNRNEPKVIYIHGRAWVSPKYQDDYAKIINEISKSFKYKVKKMIMNGWMFDTKHIIDFNLSTTPMKSNRKSFMSFDVFLKQNGNLTLKEIRNLLEDDISALISDLERQFTNNGFTIFSKKTNAN